jgi:membrane protease YdiL (CAAX protease family)
MPMLNRYLTYYKPSMQFVVFCAILSLCWLTGGFLVDRLSIYLTGLSSVEVSELKDIPAEMSNSLKWLNGILLAFLLFLPAALFAYLAYPKPAQYLGLIPSSKRLFWILALVVIALAIPFTSLIEQGVRMIPFLKRFEPLDAEYDRMAEKMLHAKTLLGFFNNVLAICLVPALIEEIFFRGCLQQLLMNAFRKNHWVVLVGVAIVFSAFHGQVSGFLPRVFLGLLLGIVYYFSGSLWLSILMHFVNNLVSVFIVYLYESETIHGNINNLPDVPIWIGIICGSALLFVLYYFYQYREPFVLCEVEKDDNPDISTSI